MKIDVKHIAKLSRISLTDDELKMFTPQMESILESVEVLKEVNTTNVEPKKCKFQREWLRKGLWKDFWRSTRKLVI